MYAWRAKIGKISPSRGDVFVYEFYKIVPEGVALIHSNLALYNLTKDEIEETWKKIDSAVLDMAKVKADVIIQGGTPLFTLYGYGSDRIIIERIEKLTGIPATTSVTSEIEAMRTLCIKKVTIATPHEKERNDFLKKFLEESNFEVVNIKGLGIREAVRISEVPFYASYRLAKETFLEKSGADGIFIPCARWPTVMTIDMLEKDLKVPVVTSTQAMIWHAMRKVNVMEKIKGFGRLFEEH